MNPDPSREDTLSGAADLDATIRMDVRATLPSGLEQPGDMIGRYKLIEPLGEGGFGSVWRAEQSEPIRREVALKVIKAGMDSREIIARFEAERQALALMDHPNIAGVLDAGTTDSGRPFFAMELVKGAPITDYCDAHQLTIRQRLELFIPVCQAVQHAHQKAILHRDLKPSNILVAKVDGKPVPKVIDFGIAKALGTSPEAVLQSSLLQTQAGAVIGTPQYMSPEQAGAAPDLDTRSDIYTLGIILYELLTGDTPLSRDSLRKAALDEVLRLVREADPKRPSSRVLPVTDLAKHASTSRQTEPAKLARTLSGDLDWIALKALEKERDRRYGSAAAFAQDLERYLKNEPVEAGPPSPVYRLRKLVRRNRLAFAAAAAIVASLTVGIGMTTWQWQRAEDQKEAQEQLLWNASRSEHEAAMDAFESGNNSEGIAHLVRALEYRPMNDVALAASAAHAFAGSANGWSTRTVIAFENSVACMAFSPDGRFFAAGSTDKTLRVFETATGREIGRVNCGDRIPSLSFSPDSRLIAVAGWDQTLRLIEAASAKELRRIDFDHYVNVVSFSPDGRHVAAGSWDLLRIIDVSTGSQGSLTEIRNTVNSVSFSPDGRLVAAGSDDDTMRVIEAGTGREVSKTIFGDNVNSVSFSPDGRLIAAGSNDKTMRVIDAATGREISKTEHDFTVKSLCFSPDGRFIATGGAMGVRIIETSSGKEIVRTEVENWIRAVVFNPDGRYVAVVPEDKSLRMHDASNGTQVCKIDFNARVTSACFSLDGRYLAASTEGNSVWLFEPSPGWDILKTGSVELVSADGYLGVRTNEAAHVIELTTGKEIGKTSLNDQDTSVSFSPDGRLIALGAEDGTVRVIDISTSKEISRSEFEGEVTHISFSPDRFLIAAGSKDKTVRVIEAATGKQISKTNASDISLPMLFSPNSRYVAFHDEDLNLIVIETSTGKVICTTEADNVISFSPDSRLLASNSSGNLLLTEIANSKTISRIAVTKSDVTAVAFSPDGHSIVVGCGDNTARLIESATGKEIGHIEIASSVTTVNFSPDGCVITVGSEDDVLRLFEVATGKQISKTLFRRNIESATFSSDGRYLAVNQWGSGAVIDCGWIMPGQTVSAPWAAALRLQAGHHFHPDGRLFPISAPELLQLQENVSNFIQAPPTAKTSWQHAILKWWQKPPDARTTSPWTTEPICIAVGRWLMIDATADCANHAPWHPIVPLSLAMTEPMPEDNGWNPIHGPTRQAFLAHLTLKRLREADEKIYGRYTLAGYAEWAAEIMHNDLQLHAEALEAINFALERTPREQQQSLLDMKKEIQAAISGKN